MKNSWTVGYMFNPHCILWLKALAGMNTSSICHFLEKRFHRCCAFQLCGKFWKEMTRPILGGCFRSTWCLILFLAILWLPCTVSFLQVHKDYIQNGKINYLKKLILEHLRARMIPKGLKFVSSLIIPIDKLENNLWEVWNSNIYIYILTVVCVIKKYYFI